jgi:uncharacterized protein YjgD (DUF1641 family)
MAQPIPFKLPRRDPREELLSRLENAPAEHADAVLATFGVLQALHDRGVLDLLRGVLGASDTILEQVVATANTPEAIRHIRNLLLLGRTLGEIEPSLLGDFTRAVPKALDHAKGGEEKPPGLIKLVSMFWSSDFRRGLAAFNDLLVTFGRNLNEKNP